MMLNTGTALRATDPLPFNGIPFPDNVEFLRIIDKEKVTNRCTLVFFHRTDDSTYYESPEGTRRKNSNSKSTD